MQGVTASLAGRAATQQFEVEAGSSAQQGEILQLHHQVADRVRQTLMRWYSRGGGSPIRSVLHCGLHTEHCLFRDEEEFARLAREFSKECRERIKRKYFNDYGNIYIVL